MMTLEYTDWGEMPDGTPVKLFTLANGAGLTARITNFGGIITELHTPDREGQSGNIALGFGSLGQYLKGHPFFGAIAGRVANRIASATFQLDGQEYPLAANNGPNHLHGGLRGFDKVVWEAKILPATSQEAALELTHESKDGEEGYPGNLRATVVYALTTENELKIDYTATTDKPTLINLTNHSYFNLAYSGDVLDHELMLAADHYTPVDEGLIPTGEIASVKDTPFDFTRPMRIGARIDQLKPKPGGYDHNFALNSGGKSLALAARVYERKSGRVMEVRTTEPGIQLYTGNFLDGSLTSTGGLVCQQHAGFCLETQHFPDAIHRPNFPSIVLRPGETYKSTTSYKFSARKRPAR